MLLLLLLPPLRRKRLCDSSHNLHILSSWRVLVCGLCWLFYLGFILGSKREREKEKEVSVELFFHRPQHLGLRKKVAGGRERKPSAFKLLHVFLLILSDDDDGLRVPFWNNCVVVSYFRLGTDDTYFQVWTVEKQCTATRSNVLYSSRRIKEAWWNRLKINGFLGSSTVTMAYLRFWWKMGRKHVWSRCKKIWHTRN